VIVATLAAAAAAALLAAPAAGAPVTPDGLRARYGGIRRLEADVVQVKEGKHWARPFESRVKLRYTPARVEWETTAPVHALAVIEGEALYLVGPDGQRRDMGPMAGDPRLEAILRFVKALLSVDLAGIERDFVLAYGPGELTATPRPGSQLELFTAVRLRFEADLGIASVDLETKDEKTHLRFERVVQEPAPAGRP
jgi:hypothetical protein